MIELKKLSEFVVEARLDTAGEVALSHSACAKGKPFDAPAEESSQKECEATAEDGGYRRCLDPAA